MIELGGQGDVILAEKLTESIGTRLLACFIHEVLPPHETATKYRGGKKHVSEEEARAWLQIWRGQKIYLAKDYVSLAAEVTHLATSPAELAQPIASLTLH